MRHVVEIWRRYKFDNRRRLACFVLLQGFSEMMLASNEARASPSGNKPVAEGADSGAILFPSAF